MRVPSRTPERALLFLQTLKGKWHPTFQLKFSSGICWNRTTKFGFYLTDFTVKSAKHSAVLSYWELHIPTLSEWVYFYFSLFSTWNYSFYITKSQQDCEQPKGKLWADGWLAESSMRVTEIFEEWKFCQMFPTISVIYQIVLFLSTNWNQKPPIESIGILKIFFF